MKRFSPYLRSPWVIMPLAAALAFGGWFTFLRSDATEAAETPADTVVEATVGTMSRTVSADGTIAAGARQHHADGPVSGHLGQAAEEQIDRRLGDRLAGRRNQAQAAVLAHHHVEVGRSDIHRVGLRNAAFGNVEDGHVRGAAEQLAHQAAVRGRHMLHHHEGQAQALGQPRKQSRQSLQPTGRRSDAHDERTRGSLIGGSLGHGS